MTDKQLDVLAKAVVDGKVESIRPDACPGCKGGTVRACPTPNWPNRFVCDKCSRIFLK